MRVRFWVSSAPFTHRKLEASDDSITRNCTYLGHNKRRRTIRSIMSIPAARDLFALRCGVLEESQDIVSGNPEAPARVWCCITVEPRCIVEAVTVLTPEEALQQDFWKGELLNNVFTRDAAPPTLWMFDVKDLRACPSDESFLFNELTMRRTAQSVAFCQLSDQGKILLSQSTRLPYPAPDYAMRLPLSLVTALVNGTVTSIVVPSPCVPANSRRVKARFADLHAHFELTRLPAVGDMAPFALGDAKDLAQDLRYLFHNDGLRFTPEQRDVLRQWIEKLVVFQDSLGINELPFRKNLKTDQILRLALLSKKLRDTGHLERVVSGACDVLLPKALGLHVRSIVKDCSSQALGKPGLSRLRLFIDVAWMLWKRCQNFPPRPAFVRYLAWDSSPQYGIRVLLHGSLLLMTLRFREAGWARQERKLS
jgi:hypothetical protein